MEERIEDHAFRIDELHCLCGGEYVYRNYPKAGGITWTQLFCPKCGLSMRAPDGAYEWLRQHWRDIVMEGANTAVADHKQLAAFYDREVARRQNLNLYCDYLMKHFLNQSQQDAVMEHFSGMPGYSEIEAAELE